MKVYFDSFLGLLPAIAIGRYMDYDGAGPMAIRLRYTGKTRSGYRNGEIITTHWWHVVPRANVLMRKGCSPRIWNPPIDAYMGIPECKP